MADDYKIELFIFPDGTAIEMLVFDDALATGPGGGFEAVIGGGDWPSAEPAAAEQREPSEHRRATKQQTATLQPLPPDADVHVCPMCGCDLVYPTDWTRLDGSLWRLSLRCPNCQLERDVALVREAVERFNRLLYHGAQVLAREAQELSRQHFEEEAEKLVAALRGDLILPMDF